MSHRTALAILAALVLLLAGCTVAWTGSVSLDVDPSPVLELQAPDPDPPPSLRAAPS